MKALRPVSTQDLTASEHRFVDFIHKLDFGRIESLRIERGQLILDPWPATAKEVKFCSRADRSYGDVKDFSLKQQLVELVEYVRNTERGEIRRLEIKNGLPFSMEVEHRPSVAEEGSRG